MTFNSNIHYCRECHQDITERHAIQGLHDSCAVVFYTRIAELYESQDKGDAHHVDLA